MVHAPKQATPRAASIAGGFVPVPVGQLMAAWRACRSAPLGVADFRAWLACREMRARRKTTDRDRSPSYTPAELARLLGVSHRRARASIKRLVDAGLLDWSDDAIGFPRPCHDDASLADSIGRGKGTVALPRRLLRLLAGGARPALIATALGILLRCLSRRRRGFDGRGRVKASWIARTFGVDVRRVKDARAELVALGWIEPQPTDQRAMNRWGPIYRIDLAWDRADGRRMPPPHPPERAAIATPSVDPDPLTERPIHQEPARRGPAGVEPKGPEEQAGPLPAPTLANIRPEDLRDIGRTLRLYDRAVARQLVGEGEAERLKFCAAAEHARAVGTTNPGGLLARLVRRGWWHFATQDDEDVANARLKRHRFGSGPEVALGEVCRRAVARPISSEDAVVVREVRAAMIRAGIFRDPFAAFQARNPGWTRERWDRALEELESGHPRAGMALDLRP